MRGCVMATETTVHDLLRRAHYSLATGVSISPHGRAIDDREATVLQQDIAEWLREHDGGTEPGDWKGDAARDQGPKMEPEYL